MTRYEQRARQIETAIRTGVLRPGDRLPSVREAARTWRASASTVFQAYYLLESRGLVEARERSGYFVLPPRAPLPPPARLSQPHDAARDVEVSDKVFQMLAEAARGNEVPIGSPFPDPSLFPLRALGLAMSRAARSLTPRETLNDLSPGKRGLRRQIALRYIADGMSVDPEEIVVTNGALEALTLSLACLAGPGDTVLVESPAFYAALQALERMRIRAVEVATHPGEGVDLDRLEHALKRHRPKACWLMPTFQNPLGATMPDDRKQALVKLLAHHGVPLIEDDVYGELHFGPRRLPPAKAWDREGLVLHCSSFSKCLSPGYRVGWVAAGRFAAQVARQKTMTTLMTSMPGQLGLENYLQGRQYEHHLRRLRTTLGARYRQMADAIGRHFPEGTCATEPQGGYFMWVQMPEGVDAGPLQRHAHENDFCVVPGTIFSSNGAMFGNCLRVNFSYAWTDRIEAGIAGLGAVARRALDRAAVPA